MSTTQPEEGKAEAPHFLANSAVPAVAQESVLFGCVPIAEGTKEVHGYEFNNGVDFDAMMTAYKFSGFQATNLGNAIDEVNRMRAWRLSDEPITEDEDDDFKDPEVRKNTKCKIFFSYTSNMISAGVRETIRYLCEHKMVDVMCTTAGGIEEDFIKCLAPTYIGAFDLDGKELRKKGHNRIGNMLVPNSNYCSFEDWLNPILNQMLVEQERDGTVWSPSKMIWRFGKEINHPGSVYYWAWRNQIPIYCPAITDGSIGDMVYFHSYTNPGLVIDIAQDIRGINDEAVQSKRTGMMIIGGGLVKVK